MVASGVCITFASSRSALGSPANCTRHVIEPAMMPKDRESVQLVAPATLDRGGRASRSTRGAEIVHDRRLERVRPVSGTRKPPPALLLPAPALPRRAL